MRAAATDICDSRSMRRKVAGRMKSRGAKSTTSAADLDSKRAVSNAVIGRTPEQPSQSRRMKAS